MTGLARVRERLRHLDLRLQASPEVTVRVIEFPGRWMSATDCATLIGEMRQVVHAAIGHDLDYGVFTDDPERMRQAIITLLYDRATGRPIAFNALASIPIELHGAPAEVVHLGLVMVDPSYRLKGLTWVLYGLTCILLFVRRQLRPIWISNVTQVPAVFGRVAEAFASAYPNPFVDVRRSFAHVCVARQIMARHRHVFGVGAEAGFDEQRFVITDAYTGGSDNLKKAFAESQQHRDPRANAMCERELDYRRGDDFLQIACIDLPSTRNYLLRDVPRRSLPAILVNLGFLWLADVMLPVLHWLDPSTPLRDLRARGGSKASP